MICTPHQNYSGVQIENIDMGGECSTHGGGEVYTVFFCEETCGKRPLGRPRRGWEDNIKTELQKVGWGTCNWIDLA